MAPSTSSQTTGNKRDSSGKSQASCKRRRTAKSKTSEPAPQSASNDEVQEVESPAVTADVKNKAKAQFEAKYDTSTLSDEEILRLQSAKWKSEVYDHFKEPTIVYVQDDVHYKFVCKYNPTSSSLTRVRWDGSTGNLKRHVDMCTQKVAPPDQGINNWAHGSTYSKARMRYLLAKWVARHHRPHAIVQNDELLEIFCMLYSRVEAPHPTTVSRDVREIFKMAQENVSKELQNHPGRLHLCVDGWMSPNTFSFLGVTVHRVVEGEMKSLILDFIKLIKGHTGIYLAEELRQCLKRFGIHKRILALVADNTSNNAVLVIELESLGGINSSLTRVRCFAHILNLVVKAIILPFSKKRSTAVEEEEGNADADGDEANEDVILTDFEDEDMADGEDEYEVDEAREEGDEIILEAVIEEVEKKYAFSSSDVNAGCYAVTKLVTLAKRVFHSPTLREDLKTCCENESIKPMQMKRAVPTRWNSLAEAIGRAIALRKALDKLLHLEKYNKSSKRGGLKHLRLSENEWVILEQLHKLLKGFLLATERISKSNVPLLHEVIPLIDVLTSNLTETAANDAIVPAVRLAAARGIRVMNKYYSLTDDSIMYRIAMILHPRYKTDYFRRLGWPKDWIRTAEDLVRDQWNKHYKPKSTSSAVNASASTFGSQATDQDDENIFSELDAWDGGNTTQDPIEHYLATPAFPSVKDPLKWWNSQMVGGNEMSAAAARMSLNFLSAPASSTDVERAFSRGGLTVSKRRHALNDESTRAATVLGSWVSVPGAIPEQDIVSMFREKCKQTEATKVANVYKDSDAETSK